MKEDEFNVTVIDDDDPRQEREREVRWRGGESIYSIEMPVGDFAW